MNQSTGKATSYTADDIEVLEGLEPVRRRPGMYIGGTDKTALHHLVAEVLDNAMDEAVAGHASRITLHLDSGNRVTITDNGRGIPVDPHPKFPKKSALEVILTTLHSGGKFTGKVYATSGGLHGVGISVVNALADDLVIEVARDKRVYRQRYSRGMPQDKLTDTGDARSGRRGTSVSFTPDTIIFGAKARFEPNLLYRMARSRAYLFRGVEIEWSCDPSLLGSDDDQTPSKALLHFPGGLADFLGTSLADCATLTPQMFAGEGQLADDKGRVEWAVAWPESGSGFCHSYCNTISTPQGGTHESGIRSALLRGLRAWGEMVGNRRASIITSDEAFSDAAVLISLFLRDPQFQGQTKEKLTSAEATRLVDQVIKDRLDQWLTDDAVAGKALLNALIIRAEDRVRANQARDLARKTATRKLRLPGKLADCSNTSAVGSEIFLVEGDSAGGSAKQARRRENQAILPLRGKILNVASASSDKQRSNQELADLVLALGCGVGKEFDLARLRYEKVIIMTDADVDGAHIASLLMTFFWREMPQLIRAGHLYLAKPPLYRLSKGSTSVYARDDAHKDELLAKTFKGSDKVEISRFKGLGEMMPAQLKETTMDVATRSLLRVVVTDPTSPDEAEDNRTTEELVEKLMGRRAESRFNFIQENARTVSDVDV